MISGIDTMETHTKRNAQTAWIVIIFGQLLHELRTQLESDMLQSTTSEDGTRQLVITTICHAIKTRSQGIISENELKNRLYKRLFGHKE